MNIQKVLKKHEMWLNGEKGGERANFSNADLTSVKLMGVNLKGADLWNANLRGADLRYANLEDADLTGSNLRNADLRGANLCDAPVERCQSDRCRFEKG